MEYLDAHHAGQRWGQSAAFGETETTFHSGILSVIAFVTVFFLIIASFDWYFALRRWDCVGLRVVEFIVDRQGAHGSQAGGMNHERDNRAGHESDPRDLSGP